MDPTGAPVPRDNQVVSFCFLVGIRKAKNVSNLPMADLKIKLIGFTVLKAIDVIDIMLCKF